MRKEIWKPILNFPVYEVSNLGRIKSLHRRRFGKEIILKPAQKIKIKYLQVSLCYKKYRKEFLVHRIVWEAFNGKISKHLQINHKNGIKKDNRLSNLELCTPKQNLDHAFLNKLRVPSYGEKHYKAKLSAQEIILIKKLWLSRKHTQKEIGLRFNVAQSIISRIVNLKAWRHT